ncbi:MAG: MarR family transcriptional regulator, transcriptional regulator for hemolysin [Subtercola sp.]|nr:MarR family transcriptional regulator, transcriptional regulator for hemolysin [Subtercola sp.]
MTHAPQPPATQAGASQSQATGDETLGWTIGVLFRAWQERVPAAIEGRVPHAGRGFQILERLATSETPPTQADLAAHLGIDRTVLTYVLDDLAAEGLVERRVDPTDRRARRVILTAIGRERLGGLQRRVQDAETELLSGLTETQRNALRSLLHGAAQSIHAGAAPEHVCTIVQSIGETG